MNCRVTEWQLMQFCFCANARPGACARAVPVNAKVPASTNAAYDFDFIMVSAGNSARLVVDAL
ncbi:hypothetical protein PPGU19_024750 [Paraburkholderia sp. PGU19]|nr:hypothetical protein PPGU19_024750 [Paraburkholderia sp. PGU19]